LNLFSTECGIFPVQTLVNVNLLLTSSGLKSGAVDFDLKCIENLRPELSLALFVLLQFLFLDMYERADLNGSILSFLFHCDRLDRRKKMHRSDAVIGEFHALRERQHFAVAPCSLLARGGDEGPKLEGDEAFQSQSKDQRYAKGL
jgi:hypothetical protein